MWSDCGTFVMYLCEGCVDRWFCEGEGFCNPPAWRLKSTYQSSRLYLHFTSFHSPHPLQRQIPEFARSSNNIAVNTLSRIRSHSK